MHPAILGAQRFQGCADLQPNLPKPLRTSRMSSIAIRTRTRLVPSRESIEIGCTTQLLAYFPLRREALSRFDHYAVDLSQGQTAPVTPQTRAKIPLTPAALRVSEAKRHIQAPRSRQNAPRFRNRLCRWPLQALIRNDLLDRPTFSGGYFWTHARRQWCSVVYWPTTLLRPTAVLSLTHCRQTTARDHLYSSVVRRISAVWVPSGAAFSTSRLRSALNDL